MIPPISPPPRELAVETSIEDFATAFAYVVELRDEGGALALLGVGADAWGRARRWLERMAAEVAEERQELATAYARAFVAARTRVRDEVAAVTAPAPELAAPPASAAGFVAGTDLSLGKASNDALRDSRPPALAAAPEPAFRAVVPPGAAVEVAAAADPGINLDATAEVEVGRIRVDPLPFSHPGPGDGDGARIASAEARSRAAVRAVPASSGTTRAPVPPQAEVLPFARALQPLPLEQYASLTASLERFADKAPVILARYGVSGPEDLAAHRRHWEARFAAEPSEKAAFEARLDELRARLRGT